MPSHFLSHNGTWNRDAAALKTVALDTFRLSRASSLRLDDGAYSWGGRGTRAIVIDQVTGDRGAHSCARYSEMTRSRLIFVERWGHWRACGCFASLSLPTLCYQLTVCIEMEAWLLFEVDWLVTRRASDGWSLPTTCRSGYGVWRIVKRRKRRRKFDVATVQASWVSNKAWKWGLRLHDEVLALRYGEGGARLIKGQKVQPVWQTKLKYTCIRYVLYRQPYSRYWGGLKYKS